MRVANQSLEELVGQSRQAARRLARLDSRTKDAALEAMAQALGAHTEGILEANAADMERSRAEGKNAAFLDRLLLDPSRVAAMAKAVREVAGLPDPIGEVTEGWKRPNGLKVEKVRLPLGVVLMIYESRPNVTSDAAALCLKSGNAVILRGGSESHGTCAAILVALQEGMKAAGVPEAAVQLVPTTDREALLALLQMEGRIDLCIPRGGEGLIRFVAQNARIPVVKHYQGVCHLYVHQEAELEMAERILLNAKTQRPGVCNATECLLVDREVAEVFLPSAGRALRAKGVELRACPTSLAIFRRAGVEAVPAQPGDYGKEFLDLILAVRVVRDADQAQEHIDQYGSEHTEVIVTADKEVAQRFCRQVAASAVVVNASSRFNDGGELGLGAEIGISTSRLHAFGPMGLRELTAQKYVIHGDGQVR
ncbi:MAG: glutamate-5-semialdehyde dehydrogenase [Myxococcota bacterium]|nr:glutamate-5-semialdehyde dehydrogenase [Myxococcota bacterium]